MAGARVPATEAAEAAMRASVAAGASLGADREAARERARATGSLMTPGEVAERLGVETVELAVFTYRFSPGCGRIEPPVDVTVRCLPSAIDGVYRSFARLNESRGWASEARTSRVRVPRSEVPEGFASEGRAR